MKMFSSVASEAEVLDKDEECPPRAGL